MNLTDAFFGITDQFHTREAEGDSSVFMIRLFAERVKPRQELIDREGGTKHIDADYSRAMCGYSNDIAVLYLPVCAR